MADEDSSKSTSKTPEPAAPPAAGAAHTAPPAGHTHPHHHQAHAHQAKPHYTAARFPPAEPVAVLDDGTKVKRRVPRMRACDEKDEKGELCTGHLKRWFDYQREIEERFGREIYRCERCHTIYLPNLEEKPRTGTLAW